MGRAEFSASVTVSNANTLGGSGVYGLLSPSINNPFEFKVGSSALINRSNLFVQSDPSNTDKVYIGLDTGVTSGKWFAVLSPGQSWSIELDPAKNLKVFGIIATAGQRIGVLEVAD